jgi:hypothetical protein
VTFWFWNFFIYFKVVHFFDNYCRIFLFFGQIFNFSAFYCFFFFKKCLFIPIRSHLLILWRNREFKNVAFLCRLSWWFYALVAYWSHTFSLVTAAINTPRDWFFTRFSWNFARDFTHWLFNLFKHRVMQIWIWSFLFWQNFENRSLVCNFILSSLFFSRFFLFSFFRFDLFSQNFELLESFFNFGSLLWRKRFSCLWAITAPHFRATTA